MSSTFNRKRVFTHLFFVSLFLVIPMLAFVRPPGESLLMLSRVFVQDTTANFVLLGFFYFNYYVLLPRFFYPKRYALYALLVVLFLSFAFTLPYLAGKIFADHPPPSVTVHNADRMAQGPPGFPQTSVITFVIDEFRRHLSLFFTAIFFSFLLKERERVAALQEEKLQAELSSLKAQISPHFLFNTLNSIYALSVKKDDRAADAVLHLSGLMRYVVSDAHAYKIPVQKELEYLENYIELQKARLGKTVEVRYHCNGSATNKEIAPLILITYIENAFRYGVNPDIDDCLVCIDINIEEKTVQLQVKNAKVNLSSPFTSTGIGMNNTAQRLQHIYPGRHILAIQEDKSQYELALTIQLV